MIKTREQLKSHLEKEKVIYISKDSFCRYIKSIVLNGVNLNCWKYVKTLRKSEYYFENRNKNVYYSIMNLFYSRKLNSLGIKYGIEIGRGVFDEGLTIYHMVGIVINGDAKIGKNCMLHGANVVGNKGTDLSAPVIGNNVRLGVGAKVLGNVYIADNVQIGAGAVVLESCYEEGALLVGVPAKIKQKNQSKK